MTLVDQLNATMRARAERLEEPEPQLTCERQCLETVSPWAPAAREWLVERWTRAVEELAAASARARWLLLLYARMQGDTCGALMFDTTVGASMFFLGDEATRLHLQMLKEPVDTDDSLSESVSALWALAGREGGILGTSVVDDHCPWGESELAARWEALQASFAEARRQKIGRRSRLEN